MARAKLADRIELAGRGETTGVVELHDGDVAALAVAARILRASLLLDDPALEQLAEL
jgi:hypothetical protein